MDGERGAVTSGVILKSATLSLGLDGETLRAAKESLNPGSGISRRTGRATAAHLLSRRRTQLPL